MGLSQKKCVPCEVGGLPLSRAEAEVLMREIPAWKLSEDALRITRAFAFPDFARAMLCADAIAVVAEAEGHHPELHISWGSVVVELSTHAVGGLSENDFILAAKIDGLPCVS